MMGSIEITGSEKLLCIGGFFSFLWKIYFFLLKNYSNDFQKWCHWKDLPLPCMLAYSPSLLLLYSLFTAFEKSVGDCLTHFFLFFSFSRKLPSSIWFVGSIDIAGSGKQLPCISDHSNFHSQKISEMSNFWFF